MASQSQSITATGRYSLSTGTKAQKDTVALISVTGTFTGLAFTVQGTPDGTNWGNIVFQNLTTGATSTGSISATDSTVLMLRVPCDNMSNVGVNVTALTTGTATLQIITDALVGVISAISTTSGAVTSPITSTSANAFAVGPSGVTNPTFNVDGSTASAANGLNVKSSAAGSAVALLVLSSTTNDGITIDSKGSGTIQLNNVSGTGNVILGDAINLQFNTTTGTKIGTATTQKLAFYNSAPIVQPANTVDYVTMLTNLGLRATGGTAAATFPGLVTGLSFLGSSPTSGGVGYATGAGGAVTQATNKSTGVTLSTLTGAITMNNAALATLTRVSFTVTNTAVAATDTVLVSIKSGATTGGTYAVIADAVAAGSFQISVTNLSAGTLSEALVLNYAVLKAVAS